VNKGDEPVRTCGNDGPEVIGLGEYFGGPAKLYAR
jgi:hypothetical protein